MPSRSLVLSSRRPSSAIFLGPKDPKETDIPAQADPPESPVVVSPSAFFPSPPATNSTGSGSSGDNNSANSGSVRQRPVSCSGSASKMIPTEMYDKPISMSRTSRPNSDDEDDENDHASEEDHTARLDRRLGVNSPNENIAALQRVKSLAQRNRMALDKLSSRLNTPSPTHTARSPKPPSSSASTASSSRLSSHPHSQSVPQLQRNDTLSGSETERESLRAPTPHSYRSSSPERSSTPPSAASSHPRQRLTSAPASPGTRPSPGPSRTPRKRVSMASAVVVQGAENGRYSRNDHDVTAAALAAVASSRRSPTGGRKSRQPLPREFRDRERQSLDGRSSVEPMIPHRASFRDNGYSEHSPRTAAHASMNATSILQYSPRGARSTRFSTVRDLTRRHQTRWLSDDVSDNTADGGRRQSQRGGSAESALKGGSGVTGRLAGESLRAAGIGMRGSGRQDAPSNGDVFGEGRDADVSMHVARSGVVGPSNGRATELHGEQTQERSSAGNKSRTSGSSPRVGEAVALPVRSHLHSDPPRAPALVTERRGTGRDISSRPATSMADYIHGESGSKNGSYSIRSGRTAYDLSDRPESRCSPTTRNLRVSVPQTPIDPDRPRTAFLTGRNTSSTPAGSVLLSSLNNPQSAEHTRLMLESLSMFQTQLARLPIQSQTARDLADHSASIIRSSERLNKILRAATTNTVQQQITIEVDDEYYEDGSPNHPAQIWRDVGSDFRESLRESDDVVRSLTGFILGVGKLLKEVAGTSDSSTHLRSASVDEEVTTRLPSDLGVERGGGKRSQDGRQSVESRLSWEPQISGGVADVSRRLSSRSDLSLVRPPSSRDRDNTSDQNWPASSRNGFGPPSTSRQLFASREHREQQIATNESISDLSADYEPSPTPASRHHLAKLPAYFTPPPLPSLPSESLLQRSNTTVDQGSRRNVSLSSLTSIATIRNPNPPFALSTANPTTAVSIHTASASPEASAFPLQRTDSRDSTRSHVTFSRPSGVSVSALQQQQNRDEVRRRADSTAEEESSALNHVRSPLLYSEIERDARRRTLGVRAARKSLEMSTEELEMGGDVSQPRTITFPSQRQGRRRTVTEIFG